MTAFLVQQAEAGMMLFKALQSAQGLRYPVQASQVGGDQVQGIAVLGQFRYQRLGGSERFLVPPALA
jgi:hypothetical protein